MILSAEMERLLPSDADVAFYRNHGWYISGKILPDELIDQAIAGSVRHFAGERDVRLPASAGYSDWKPGDGGGLRNCEFVSLQNMQIRRLVQWPLLGATAARLCGSPAIRLFDDQLIYKSPSALDTTSVIGWHTDRAYWMTCTSVNMLTAWIPFHDCPVEMGPLAVIDGSHTWSEHSGMRGFNEKSLSDGEKRFSPSSELPKVPLLLTRGQVSFHNCMTIHGSDVNRGSSPRLSLAVHMQDADNRYRAYLNDRGVPWSLPNDRLSRRDANGTPDYSDPEIFPLLWSAESE